jgi:hypothetical protein
VFRKAPDTFKTASGRRATRISEVVLEPISPATETPNTAVSLRFTPRGLTDEAYVVLPMDTAAATRMRVDISVDGGAYADGTTPQAAGAEGVEQTIDVRAVGLPWAGDDPERAVYTVGVTATGEAGWED